MLKNALIITLILLLFYLAYQNRQQRKELTEKQRKLTTFQQIKDSRVSEIRKLEARIYHTDRDIVQVRKDFWNLRLLMQEWNVFKGTKEIKELVESMRNNPILEEIIK